jgi:hypothetical protein
MSHFMNFYLINKRIHDNVMEQYTQYVKHIQEMQYEAKFQKPKNSQNDLSQNQLMDPKVSQIGPNVPFASGNYTTNFSSNHPPISGSMNAPVTESIINVAVGESAFVNSNIGMTMEKQ